jgi:hypothetical protein
VVIQVSRAEIRIFMSNPIFVVKFILGQQFSEAVKVD